jgi:hypothetical protein
MEKKNDRKGIITIMTLPPQGDITEFDKVNITVDSDSKSPYTFDNIKQNPTKKDLKKKLKVRYEPDVLKVTFQAQNEKHEIMTTVTAWITNFSMINKEAGITITLGKKTKIGYL